MKILKCENGHYFDHDAYETCPLCGAPAAGKTDDKKSGLFRSRKTDTSENRHEKPEQGNETVAMPRGNFPNNADRPAPQPAPAPQAPPAAPAAPLPPAPAPAAPAAPAPEPAAAPAAPAPDLKEAIRQNSSLSDGKTLSYFSSLKQSAEAAAPATSAAAVAASTAVPSVPAAPAPAAASAAPFIPAAPAAPVSIDPTVGWLVCIRGAHLFEVFSLSVGLNSIGRSEGNKIVLAKDPAVSREKHAFVTFEPKTRKFYVRPGDSSGLTYLNDEYIYENKPLNAGDVISIGQSSFFFQPLCGENFSWEDYIN